MNKDAIIKFMHSYYLTLGPVKKARVYIYCRDFEKIPATNIARASRAFGG